MIVAHAWLLSSYVQENIRDSKDDLVPHMFTVSSLCYKDIMNNNMLKLTLTF